MAYHVCQLVAHGVRHNISNELLLPQCNLYYLLVPAHFSRNPPLRTDRPNRVLDPETARRISRDYICAQCSVQLRTGAVTVLAGRSTSIGRRRVVFEASRLCCCQLKTRPNQTVSRRPRAKSRELASLAFWPTDRPTRRLARHDGSVYMITCVRTFACRLLYMPQQITCENFQPHGSCIYAAIYLYMPPYMFDE